MQHTCLMVPSQPQLRSTIVFYASIFSTGLSFRTYSGNPCKIFFRKIEFSAKIFEFMTKFPWVCGNFLNFRKNSLLWRHCCFIGVPTFFRNIEFLKNMLEFFEKIAWVLVFLEFLISWVFFENAKRQAWFNCSLCISLVGNQRWARVGWPATVRVQSAAGVVEPGVSATAVAGVLGPAGKVASGSLHPSRHEQ